MTPPVIPPVAVDRRIPWHTAAALVAAVCAAGLAVCHWPVLDAGADRLAVADRGWLLMAGVLATLTWASSALAQQGAVREVLPAGRLVTAQFAASAANHLLPAGLGAGAVNLRFLMRCGLPPARAATALAVKSTAGAAARAVLVAVFAVLCPGVLRLPSVGAGKLLAAGALVAAVLAAAVVVTGTRLRRWLADAVADVRAVHASPPRAAALWGGSLIFAALHTGVVIAVVRALDVPLSAGAVALAYLAASSAAVLLPTPGGLGSLDAALAWALTAAGAPGSAGVSAVLGYRLLTVWIPLVPGLLVLAVMLRRKAL